MDESPTKRRGPLLWLAGRSRRFWTMLAAAAPVLYAVSLPPLQWIEINAAVLTGSLAEDCLMAYWWPALLIYGHSPEPIPDWLEWYVMLLL